MPRSKDRLAEYKRIIEQAINRERHNRTAASEDRSFYIGAQWDLQEKKRRQASHRPCLQMNLLPKVVNQLVGDQRLNRPRIKVRSVDSKGDGALAQLRQGLIYNIEQLSSADAIYDSGYKDQVVCGYGAWVVLTRQNPVDPFVNEIYIQHIADPLAVYMDYNATDFLFSDAKWGFYAKRYDKTEFTRLYPKAKDSTSPLGLSEVWGGDDTVTVVEFYEQVTVPTDMVKLEDGSIMTEEEGQAQARAYRRLRKILQGAPGEGMTIPAPNPIIAKKKVDRNVVRRYTLTAEEILDEEEVPGSFIPLVLLRGDVTYVKGREYASGVVRHARDPQKIFNYFYSAAAEYAALSPKSTWIATPKQVEGCELDYARALTEPLPILLYTPDSEAPPPTLIPPSQIPVTMLALLDKAERGIQMTTGLFNRDLGDSGREVSGSAIFQVQKAGDTGTFFYFDNLTRAIGHTGRIINDMLPVVYDTEREVRVKNRDDTERAAIINTSVKTALAKARETPGKYDLNTAKLEQMLSEKGNTPYNDMRAGRFEVDVQAGPGFTTQRQESARQLLELYRIDPMKMSVALDLIVKDMDVIDAQELSQRLRKLLPPGIVPPTEEEMRERASAPPPQPPPEIQFGELKVAQEQVKLEVAKVKLEVEKTKAGLQG